MKTKRVRRVLMLLGAYDPKAHRGIARAAREFGWHLDVSVLKTFQLDESWKGDGIICSLNRNRRLERFVLRSGLPTVDLSIWRQDLDLPRVVADNNAIGREGAEHLLGFGHRNFCWFALSRNPVGEARFAGYRDRLEEGGCRVIRLDGRSAHRRDVFLERLAEVPKPCALFCKSDDDAAWVQSACLEGGIRIPEEAAILGVDNNELICEHQPVPLSSVNHDLEQIGYEGARMLESLMAGRAVKERLRFIAPSGVSVRGSTDALAVEDAAIREALLFLEENLRASIGTTDVAAHVGLSRRSLELRFRKALGVTVHQWLLGLRLKEAERLLRETDETVETIAALCGFSHAPHLSRAFKLRYGAPPLRYRNAQVDR